MIDKLHPMMSGGKKFRAIVMSISDPNIIREALNRWGNQYSKNQRRFLESRLADLEPRGIKIREPDWRERIDVDL